MRFPTSTDCANNFPKVLDHDIENFLAQFGIVEGFIKCFILILELDIKISLVLFPDGTISCEDGGCTSELCGIVSF